MQGGEKVPPEARQESAEGSLGVGVTLNEVTAKIVCVCACVVCT